MKKTDSKNTKFFFDNYSKKFDEIYDTTTNSNSFLKIIVNETFRKSMKTRYVLALNEVKKIKKN